MFRIEYDELSAEWHAIDVNNKIRYSSKVLSDVQKWIYDRDPSAR